MTIEEQQMTPEQYLNHRLVLYETDQIDLNGKSTDTIRTSVAHEIGLKLIDLTAKWYEEKQGY